MRLPALLVAAALLGGCTSGSNGPAAQPSSVMPSTAVPSPTPSMSAEVVAACGHISRAFALQQPPGQDWKAVLAEVGAAWRAGHTASDRQFADLIPPPGALRIDDTQTLGEVVDSLAFSCGLPTGDRAALSPPAPNRREVQLTEKAVDGVPLGTPADEAEKRLRGSLGDANAEDVSGCDGETATRLTWGAFSVNLSNEGKGPVRLRGWTLRSGVSRVTYRTPYDVQPGDAVRDVLNRVPGAKGVIGEGPTGGHYVVFVDRSPDLLWISDDKGRAGKVEQIVFHDPSCD